MTPYTCPDGHSGRVSLVRDLIIEQAVLGEENGNLVVSPAQVVQERMQEFVLVCRGASGTYTFPPLATPIAVSVPSVPCKFDQRHIGRQARSLYFYPPGAHRTSGR